MPYCDNCGRHLNAVDNMATDRLEDVVCVRCVGDENV